MEYNKTQLEKIIAGVLDERVVNELPTVDQFNHQLRQTWRAKQSQTQLVQHKLLSARLDRVAAWLLDEASADQIRQARQDIEADASVREFYEMGKQLKERLEFVDFLPASDAPAISPKAISNPSPLYALRDGGQTTQTIVLPIPDDYGFGVRLTVTDEGDGGFRVRGRVSTANRTALSALENATIWLLPSDVTVRRWPETTLTRTGSFQFGKTIPSDLYRFEMNWTDEFLEVMDVAIPALEE